MKKRIFNAVLAAGVMSAMVVSGVSAEGATAGVVWYNAADTFIANETQCLNTIAAADGTVSVATADSQNDITVQDQNVSNFYTQGVKYLVLNNINNAAADSIADQMAAEGVVGIFANTTPPSDEAFERNENLWYVSSASTQSGENMGNALVDYFNGHENWERNGNGIELKQMLEQLKPDMAIVHVRMPGLTGIEVIELVQHRGCQTHFIINTAYSDFDYVKRALDLKTDGYLLKPGRDH